MSDQYELRRLVDRWIEEAGDWFTTRDIWNQFNVTTMQGKEVVYQRLKEHKEAGRVKKKGLRYRHIKRGVEDLDIFADPKFVDIKYPLQLERYVRVTEGALIVIAGGKDAGKTGFLLNIAYLNMNSWEIHFFDSESGATLLAERLLALDPNLSNPLGFKIHPIARNFSDVIVPDALNFIDYLDLGSQYQMVGDELLSIVEAVGRGVACVALQKPPPSRTKDGRIIIRDLGYGGLPTIHRAQLALSIDKGNLKIIAAKSRVNGKVDPINKTFHFHLENKGMHFVSEDTAERELWDEEI